MSRHSFAGQHWGCWCLWPGVLLSRPQGPGQSPAQRTAQPQTPTVPGWEALCTRTSNEPRGGQPWGTGMSPLQEPRWCWAQKNEKVSVRETRVRGGQEFQFIWLINILKTKGRASCCLYLQVRRSEGAAAPPCGVWVGLDLARQTSV